MTPEPGSVPPTRPLSDPELITAVRAGDPDAFAELYVRHVDAARRLALALARNQPDADDLVAEAFAKLLATLRDGGGPNVAFRAYLLTTVRNLFYDRSRRDQRVKPTDDLARHDPGVPFVDPAVQGLEHALVARAFARLPERWQTVLWHTTVEGESPAAVARRRQHGHPGPAGPGGAGRGGDRLPRYGHQWRRHPRSSAVERGEAALTTPLRPGRCRRGSALSAGRATAA